MNDFFDRIKTSFMEFYQKLNKKTRILILGGSITFFIIIAALIWLYSRPDYVELVSDVTPAEAGKITTKLDALNIGWSDSNGSSTILVDKDNLSKAKMSLAVDGLLGEPDFTWTDMFASSSLTMTSEEINQMKMIAKASALKSAIKSLDPIEDAKVELYIPADSSFLYEENQESRASVIVKLKGGQSLNESQVSGIVNILVTGVKNLEASNITLTDSSGRQLNDNANSGDEFYNISNQTDLKRSIENRLTSRLSDLLSTMYGSTNIKVMPTVKLNFDDKTTSTTTFQPPNEGETTGLIRNMNKISEEVINNAEGGVPGVDSNTESTNYAESGNDESTYKKVTEQLNYELNEINTVLQEAKGQIEDITIGVIINKKILPDETLSDDHKKELEKLISASSGLNTKVVEISSIEFAAPDDSFDVFSSDESANIGGIPIWIFIVFAVVLIGVIAVFIVIMRRNSRIKDEEIAEIEKEAEEEINALTEEDVDKSSPKYQIEKFIDTNPEIVAQLLKSWISEE